MHAQDIPNVTLLEELGRGQGGVVFRALHRGRTCTVKVPSDASNGAFAAQTFERDVLSLARLRRAGLPRVLQVDSSGNTPYAIMDVAQGQTLPEALQSALHESQLLQLALSLTQCLHELHDAGFVHGGLMADQVLVSKEGAVVSWLDRGTVSRPVTFDPREDLEALGRILRQIASRIGGGHVRSVVLSLAQELLTAQRLELRTVTHELEQLLHAETSLPKSYPPPSPDSLSLTHSDVLFRSSRGELDKLRQLWEQSAQRGGKVVQLLGPAGSGKSRLLGRFVQELVEQEVQVLAVTCSDNDWAPFSALKRLLDGHLEGLTQVSKQRRAEIEGLLRTSAGVLASHIGLLSPRLAQLLHDAPTSLQEGVAQQVFIAGIADFLAKYLEASGRSVLLFDNFHSADASSRRVLTLLAARICGQGHMLVCSARDDLESQKSLERFRSTLAPELVESIRMEPLSTRDAKHLVASYLGLEGAPSSELVTQLTRLCDGTPLSLLALLELTFEQGLLRPYNSHWRLDAEAVHRMRLPRASRTLIARRFSLLSGPTLEVLRTAAALRDRIDPTLIALVTGIGVEQVRGALQRGVSVRLLELDPHGTPKFVHDCVWEIALAEVAPARLRALHQRIAMALEEAGGHGAAYDYQLAQHYAEGQIGARPQRAFVVLRRAARRALEACDDALALSFLRPAERAAALASIEPERAFYVDLAETSLRTGSIAECLSYFERALQRSDRRFERAQVLGRISWVHHYEGNPIKSWQALEAALIECDLPVPTDSPSSVLAALPALVKGQTSKLISWRKGAAALGSDDAETVCELYLLCAMVSGDNSRPIRALSSIIALAAAMPQVKPCRALVRAELMCAFVLCVVSPSQVWRSRFDRALALAQELEDPIAQTLCHQFHHVIAGWTGDIQEAERQARICMDERGHWMELGELCHVCFSMYGIEVVRGRPLAGLGWLQRAIDRVQQCGRAPAVFGLIEQSAVQTLESLGRELDATTLRRRLQRIERGDVRQGYFHWLSFQGRIQQAMEKDARGDALDRVIDEWDREKQEPGSVHLLVSICYIQIAHARIHQCLRASPQRRAALLPKLARALRALRRVRRVPQISAHVQVASAAYWYFRGNQAKSEELLALAKHAAQVHGCVWVTFAAARLRAHQLRSRGLFEAARNEAAFAELIARQYSQTFHARCIRDEFELAAPPPQHTGAEVDAQQVRRHLEALLQITAATGRELSPERHACFILDELLSFLAAERAFLFMRSDNDGSLVPRAARKIDREDIDANSGYDAHIVRQVYATGQPVMREAHEEHQPERMCIAVALVLREQVVGVLYVDRAEAAGSFSAEDVALLQALANQVPVSVELASSLRERDNLQQNLRQAQKMEAIGRLAGGIAHDFNNVLTAIKLAAAVMGTSSSSGEELEEIQAAAGRGAELTHQLLMFSRGISVEPRNFELSELVRGLHTTLQRLVRSDAQLIIDVPVDPLRIIADPSQIERALINLCKNASEALPGSGGEICLRLKLSEADEDHTTVGLDPERTYALIEVSDTGTGMTEEVRSRLFEPFFTTKASQGTGLGLANVYAIVQQSGGHIDVRSEVGRGSLFRVFLPIAPGPFSATEPRPTILPPPLLPPVAAVSRSTATALVVDDDDTVRRQVARALQRAGYRVLVARDGEDALRVVADAKTIDLAITDVHMPSMGGSELANVLLARNPALKLIFMSGDATADLRQREQIHEGAVLLKKPLDLEAMLASVAAPPMVRSHG